MMTLSGRGSALQVHPGYIAGNWYQPIAGSAVAAGTAIPANTLSALPFVLTRPIKVQALGARLTTASAGGNFQLAIYANNPATGRPTGTALVSTGDISTASAAAVSAAVAAQATLPPGNYWMALNQDNGTAAYQTLASSIPMGTALVGSATLGTISSGTATALLTITVSHTFGTWPDLTSASFTELVAASRSALVFVQAA